MKRPLPVFAFGAVIASAPAQAESSCPMGPCMVWPAFWPPSSIWTKTIAGKLAPGAPRPARAGPCNRFPWPKSRKCGSAWPVSIWAGAFWARLGNVLSAGIAAPTKPFAPSFRRLPTWWKCKSTQPGAMVAGPAKLPVPPGPGPLSSSQCKSSFPGAPSNGGMPAGMPAKGRFLNEASRRIPLPIRARHIPRGSKHFR